MPKVTTIFSRVDEFRSDGFYVFDREKETVMCKFCNTRVDWVRADSCKKHVLTDLHKGKKAEAQRVGSIKRQVTLDDTLNKTKKIRLEKEEFASDLTEAFVRANIPLEKVENASLRNFLNKYCPGAGDLPHADTLRAKNVPAVGEKRLQVVKEAVKDRPVVILCDETTDRKERCVFVVLIRPLCSSSVQKVYVGSVKVLENANGAECARAILGVVMATGIQFENVMAVVTDSAQYMGACVDSLRVPFSPNMVHVQCWAHRLNIIASMWGNQLPELNTCVSQAKSLFLNTRKRKHRYLPFLNAKYPEGEKKATLFPMPVLTRWNSWFKSVEYVNEYAEDLKEFAATLDEESSAIMFFRNLTDDGIDEITTITASSTFLIEHCKPLIQSILVLEGNSYPYVHKVYGKLQDHLAAFKSVGNEVLGEETTNIIGRMRSVTKRSQMKEKLKYLALQCHTKLSKLVSTDNGKLLYANMSKLFDVRNIALNNIDPSLGTLTARLPVMSAIPLKVLVEGYATFQEKVKEIMDKENSVDILAVLLGLRESHSRFVDGSIQALWIPPSSVDAERAFSHYNNILTDLRTNLKPENLEIMLASYFEQEA